MKYLYFDVECASCKGGRGKICTFGYVLTDESFNVLYKEDIIINPKIERKQYDWYVVKNILSYSIKEIESNKDFAENYITIKNLLTNPNHITLGFDVYNDLKYINDECVRYDLPKIQIKSYDVQDFYKEYSGNKNRINLFKLAEIFEIDKESFKEHNSRDDAHITMLIAKTICNKMSIDISSMLELCDRSIVEANKKGDNAEKEFSRKLRRIAEKYPNRNTCPAICISDTIKMADMNGRLNLIKEIFKNGYNYTYTVGECKYFIANKEYGEKELAYDCIMENEKNVKDIKKITIANLSKMLNIEINERCEYIKQEEIDVNNPLYLAFKRSTDKKGISLEDWKNSL